MDKTCHRIQTIILDQWAEKLTVGDKVQRVWHGDVTVHTVIHTAKCKVKIDTGDTYLKNGRQFGAAILVPPAMAREEIEEYLHQKHTVSTLSTINWSMVSKENLDEICRLLYEQLN